jgi:apolipoprotein N-acyltransferase
MAIGLGVMTTIRWPIAALVLGGLYLWSAATWTASPVPDRWIGVHTRLGGNEVEEVSYVRQVEILRLVRSAIVDRHEVIVLPENAFGPWTQTTEAFWMAALQGTDVMVLGGATIWDGDSYDNALVAVTSAKADVVYRARMPVPVSMWQPWRSAGRQEGANANLFAVPVVSVGGLRVAPLICYELLLVWPILQSMSEGPEVIVAVGNGWWAGTTHVVAVQKSIALAWSRLFARPLVMAFNV